MLILFVLAHWGHHLLSSIVPPLLPFVREQYGIDVAQAGALVSAFTIAYGVSQLPAGWLADRIGQRLVILLGISGVAVWGVFAGLSPSYWVMLACMVLLGLFGGGYHPSSAPLVSATVETKRRGWALGIHQIGGTASNLSAPLIAAGLATYLGWRSAFIGPGVVVIALGILLYLLLGRPSGRTAESPAEAEAPVVTAAQHARAKSKLIVYIVLGTAAQVFILSIIAFVPLFVVDGLGKSDGFAAAFQSVIYLGGLPAGPIAGYLSDRLGANRVLLVSALVAGPVLFLLNAVTSVWLSVPILLVMGALLFTIMPVSEHYIIGQTSTSNRSTVLGAYYAASRGGSGFLTLGVGYLIQVSGFQLGFALAGAVLFAIIGGCGLALLAINRKSPAGTPVQG